MVEVKVTGCKARIFFVLEGLPMVVAKAILKGAVTGATTGEAVAFGEVTATGV